MPIKSIEEVPLLQITLRPMKFCSLLLKHNWRRYFNLIVYFIMNISQFLDLYYTTESVDSMIRNAYTAVLFFNCLFRGVMLCWKEHEFEEFMEFLRQLYVEIMEIDDCFLQRMLAQTTNIAKLLTKINLSLGAVSIIAFVIYPVFATSKVLPFGMLIPIIDKYESPYYEICFVAQIIMAPMGCCLYIPFTNLIVAFILFGILMSKVLQYKLRCLSQFSKDKVNGEIVLCIQYHMKLQSFVGKINNLTTYVFLVEFITFGAMLCGMLFMLLIVETLGQQIMVSCYIVMIFVQSVVMYYFANELYVQSIGVSDAAYECSWYDFDIASQKTIQLLILKSQRPLAILIGNVYPMTLEQLQSLLNITYSYFTLLKRFYG